MLLSLLYFIESCTYNNDCIVFWQSQAEPHVAKPITIYLSNPHSLYILLDITKQRQQVILGVVEDIGHLRK